MTRALPILACKIARSDPFWRRRLTGGVVKGLFAGVEETGDTHAEGAALVPAAVGQGWVVGGGCGEVPVLVCSVKACAVAMLSLGRVRLGVLVCHTER